MSDSKHFVIQIYWYYRICLIVTHHSLDKMKIAATVYPKKYAHGFVVLCFVVVMESFITNSHEVFIHIHQGCFAGTGAIVRLPQCQWSKPDRYGEISQGITTTKHSKAKTVCIFLGIYCISQTVFSDEFHGKYDILNIIALKFVPKGAINTNPALVRLWVGAAPSHYLNQCWPDSPTHKYDTSGVEYGSDNYQLVSCDRLLILTRLLILSDIIIIYINH